MFETQKSGNKTSSGGIGLNIRTIASPKVGQDQVSGGVSVPCRHVTPVADSDNTYLGLRFENVVNQGNVLTKTHVWPSKAKHNEAKEKHRGMFEIQNG